MSDGSSRQSLHSLECRIGDRLVHPADPDLGVGVVRAIKGRFLDVFFPDPDRSFRLTTEIALQRFELRPGQAVRVVTSDERTRVVAIDRSEIRLEDGRTVAAAVAGT